MNQKRSQKWQYKIWNKRTKVLLHCQEQSAKQLRLLREFLKAFVGYFHCHTPCEIPSLVVQQSSFLTIYLGKHQLLFQEFHSFPFLSRDFITQINFHQALDGFMLQWKSFVWEKNCQKAESSFNHWIWSGQTENYFGHQTYIFEFIMSVNEYFFLKWVSI